MADQQDFQNWEVDKLSNHIITTHHVYAREASKQIIEAGDKIAKSDSEKYPELVEITNVFAELAKGLEEHMTGEEKYLFPYLEKLLNAKNDGGKLPRPGFGSLDVPLKQHYEDHADADKLMKQINKLSNGYALPDGVSDAHKTFYALLKEFETDLEQHIYVENEVLFDKSIQLEKLVVG